MAYGDVYNSSSLSNRHRNDYSYSREEDKIKVVVAGIPALHATIQRILPDRLYDVVGVDDRSEIVDAFDNRGCDLLIINTSLKGLDGMADLRSLSSTNRFCYIVTYIDSGDEIDKILALELGADECLTSSCSPREIEARVRALLRRCASEKARLKIRYIHDNISLPDIVQFSGWSLNRDTFQVTSPSGIDVHLTRAEYVVLSGLVRGPILVKGQNSALKCTDDNGEPCNNRSLDSIVSRIRKKMNKFGGGELIETVRGQGYKLSVSPT